MIDELVREILDRFPKVEYDGLWDKGDGTVGIRLWCNSRDSWRVSEVFAWRIIEILEKHGYDLVLLTLDRTANGRGRQRKPRTAVAPGTVKAAAA